ncbi:ZCCHC8_2 [Sanghuangporus sanghuang]
MVLLQTETLRTLSASLYRDRLLLTADYHHPANCTSSLRQIFMAPVTPRNGAFSPTLSSATSYTGTGPSKLNIVSRLAIEGKVKQSVDGASIKLYLKIGVPIDSVTPGQIIPIFAEENIKIRDYSVHPLDSDSVPYNFSSSSHPLLHNAARALNLPARSTKSYLSLFDTTPQSTPGRGSVNGSAVPALEERYTGYFLISGYNVCYVVSKEFPSKYKMKSGTDSESDVRSARGMHRTPSHRSGSTGRRYSVGDRNTIQFMAGLSLWVPFSSKPPKAPFMISIPIPKCLSNHIKVRLPSPSSISTSFASLESDEDLNGWDLATEPHVTRTTPIPKLTGRTSAYTEFADDESSEASFTGSALENCLIHGTFTSTDRIRIRWAAPLRVQDYPDGRRRVGVDEVAANMTCTILETRADGVKMRLDYQGTCTGVWFPGVATMLGMDVGLDTQGARVYWPPDSDGQWTIDGDPALTGFTVGLPQTTLSPQATLDLPSADASGLLGETIQNGPARNNSDNSASLLRAPLPNRRISTEYSFEDSLNGTSITSSIVRSDPESASESFARPPATPITVHINMTELAPTKNKLTLNISGTVLIAPGPGMPNLNDSGQTTLPLPTFRVFSAAKDDTITTIRNQCDTASVELINSGSPSISGQSHSPRSRHSLGVSGSRAKRTFVPSGSQAKCISPESSEILVKPLAPRTPARAQELSPQMLGRSVPRAAASLPGSPEPISAVLRSQPARSTMFRDGPLVIPWVTADAVPIITVTSTPYESRSVSSNSIQMWSYAVTLALPTPVDAGSDWLEFGLAVPPNASSSEPTPVVEVTCASVNGVPVRFEAVANSRIDLSTSTSSLTGGSTETISSIDAGAEKRKWLNWVRVHVALAGALEVVYIVKGQAGGTPADKKGKRKAGSSGGLNKDEVRVFVPVFSLPVSRFEINLRRSSDIVLPKTTSDDPENSSVLCRKIFIYDVPALTHSRADLTMAHPVLADKTKPSRRRRHTATRTLLALATALPCILSAVMLTQTINTRREVQDLRTLIYPDWGDAALPDEGRVGGFADWRTQTVTVTSTVTETPTSRPTSSERRWFGDTYTVSYSAPTPKAKPPRPVKHDSASRDGDDSEMSNGKSGNDDDDSFGDEGSSFPPILSSPLSWTSGFDFDEAKAQVLSGWGRVWRVVEIILHWPLPVDDDDA